MKQHKNKRILSLLLALVLVMGISAPILAADSSVTFENKNVLTVTPGQTHSTSTDLFDSFKNVMPGDTLTEQVIIENQDSSSDYIRVYLRAVPHHETENPISAEVSQELQQDSRRGSATSELDYMNDFLSQLRMMVWNGEGLIYDNSPDKPGDLTENVYLGMLRYNDTITLDVNLEVPIEMGNKYADRIGEVDWAFVVHAFDSPSGGDDDDYDDDDDDDNDNPIDLEVEKVWDDNNRNRPDSVKVTLYRGSTAVDSVRLGDWNDWSYEWEDLNGRRKWHVVEENVPTGYVASYYYRGDKVTITNTSELIQTGQLNWPIPILGGLGALLIAYGLFVFLKKRKHDRA